MYKKELTTSLPNVSLKIKSREPHLFTIRNALLTIVLSLVFMFSFGVKEVNATTTTPMEQNYGSIVDQYLFANTAYFYGMTGYFDGM